MLWDTTQHTQNQAVFLPCLSKRAQESHFRLSPWKYLRLARDTHFKFPVRISRASDREAGGLGKCDKRGDSTKE